MGCGASAAPDKKYAAPASEAPKALDQDQASTLEFLSKVILFKGFQQAELTKLAASAVPRSFKSGNVVIRQGDSGNEFFVILEGEASVTIGDSDGKSKTVAKLNKGDHFGEKALLHDDPRTATVTATTALSTLVISQETFRSNGLINKVHFAHRKAIGGAGKRNAEDMKKAAATIQKSAEEREFLRAAFQRNANLQSFFQLKEDQVNEMIDVGWREDVPINTELITEGDIDADFFYVIESGSFDISVSEDKNNGGSAPMETRLKRSKSVRVLNAGDSFGEMALLFLAPRSATVTSIAASKVFVFDRYNVKRILMKISNQRLDEFTRHLKKVEILAALMPEELKALAEALVEIHYSKGEVIMEQGSMGKTCYFLINGEVSVQIGGKEVNRLSANKKQGTTQIFGERALLNNEARSATIEATTTAQVLAMDRDSFDLLLGPLEAIMKEQASGARGASKNKANPRGGKRERSKASNLDQPPAAACSIPMAELGKVGLLGCGGFGVVELWQHKNTKETYALKSVNKGYIVKTGAQKDIMNEKHILTMCKSPFIIGLHGTYNESQTLMFLLEPALGGELFAVYNCNGFHGSETHARFYIASVIMALEHLHSHRVIYRDLKPENVMLKETGHAKLCDMGLAKYVIGNTFTTCGTSDYFAPEIIKSQPYNAAVDWWTVGILLFELMSGYPPFEAQTPEKTYRKVLEGIDRVDFPPKCSGLDVTVLIKRLCSANPQDRLPMRPGGLKNLLNVKWYQGFEWESFKSQKMQPPYVPTVKSKTDLHNFVADPLDKPPQLKYVDDGSGWDRGF